MRKSPLNKIGRVGKANLEANKILQDLFQDKEIYSCEMRLDGCFGVWTTAFSHRHKRWFYGGDVKKLSDFKQVVLACQNCHTKTEYDRDLNDEVFKRLRGNE